MTKRIPELLILFALFVSPLLHASIEDSFQTRMTWRWCLVISFAIIAFFLRYPFGVQRIFSPLAIVVGIGSISSFFLALYPTNAFAVYIVLIAALVFFAMYRMIKNDSNNKIILIVMLIGFVSLYAQWGILQFIVQHDVGMKRIGESVLTTTIPGIASFYVGSEKFIRAYGPFGHANSLGGVLLLGAILLYKHKKSIPSPLFLQGALFVTGLGIILSFSRTAILGLAIIGVLALFKKYVFNLFPLGLTGLLFLPLLFQRSVDIHGASAHERVVGLSWFIQMMNPETFWRGFGLGNYTTALANHIQLNSIVHNPWDIAPVHSVPLFLIAELGLLLCIPLAIVLIRFLIIHKLWIFILVAPALFLDHYFATQLAPLIFLITSAYLVVQ